MQNVLYVDDDRASRDILYRLLTHQNMAVDVVESGNEALQHVSQNDYDLIVIDLALPDIDGWEVLDQIQGRVPAVALTAYYDASVAQQAKQAGFLGCFPKPATKATTEQFLNLLDK